MVGQTRQPAAPRPLADGPNGLCARQPTSIAIRVIAHAGAAAVLKLDAPALQKHAGIQGCRAWSMQPASKRRMVSTCISPPCSDICLRESQQTSCGNQLLGGNAHSC